MPEIWAEIWQRPGHATFGRSIDEAPTPTMTWHDGMNLVGNGSMAIAESFDRFDEILEVDQTTPANSVKSLVRLFSEDDPTTPFFEWLPKSILPTTDKADLNVDVAGKGIKSILSDARVEAFDWDESVSFACSVCDWVYGGANVLSNAGFEESQVTPKAFGLQISATGGTYALIDGTDTTAAIPHNANAATIETRIEADLGLFVDVIVTDTSNSPITRNITMVDPAFGVNLGIDPGLLTGGTGITFTIEEGGLLPSSWTKARTLASGLPKELGSYDQFGITSTQSHSGALSLFIDPGTIGNTSNRLLGAQQVVTVIPGGTYQASVWIRPTTATDQFRLALFTVGEKPVAASDWGGNQFPANTWTQMSITDVLVPDDVSQLIFRVQCTNLAPSNPTTFYIDDAELNTGLAPTTIGDILSDLYDDATSDHSGVRLVWEDEANPGTPYLTLDFDASLDSAGVPWFHDDIEIKLWMRMTYLQVMTQIVNTWGYEWRIVPNDVEAGTWIWQVYNPGTMKTDYTAAASPAIQGAAEDVRRSIVRIAPDATDHLVEGPGRITARYRDTDLTSALGMIEGSRLDRKLPGLVAIFDAAFEDSLDALTGGAVYVYDLTDPSEMPLVAYLLGDLLTIHDPPEVKDEARLVDVIGTATAHEVIIGVQFTPATVAGS